MIDPALGAARRRIRRIRWTTTVVFAVMTTVCLAVLVVIALRVDASARTTAFDVGLRQQAGSLSELVSYQNDGTLDLGQLDASQIEQTTPVLGVVTAASIVYAEPNQKSLPDDAELRAMMATEEAEAHVVSVVAPGEAGASIHWAVAPVLNSATVTTAKPVRAIVLVGGPVPGAQAHATLRTRLLLTGAVLVVLAALLGHVISGRAMRPAVRGLASQERFLVDAAHELRTPLSVLQIAADQAARHPDDLEAQVAATAKIRDQVRRLTALTDGLLLRARAAVGTADLSFEPLRLDQLVERTVAEMPGVDGVVVETGPSIVDANPELVGQAVRNLVENALRHGRPPVTVTVHGRYVEVTDAGAGIPSRDRRTYLRAGSSGGGGTGTGLSIASWAARIHGGSITLDEGDAGGLRVTLTFGEAGPRRARAWPGTGRRRS